MPGDKGLRSKFTKGGVNLFDKSFDANINERAANGDRDGFYGWSGFGGSSF